MSLQKNSHPDERRSPAKFYTHLPYALPVIQPKKKKKCCKKFRKGNRCKCCPSG
jgi:hypothetical protein